MKAFNQIGLEMSLKPFKDLSDAYITKRLEEIFTQWAQLLKHTDEIAVLLWIGDGSEILDYTGDFNQPMEWGKYIGSANPKKNKGKSEDFYDPEEIHHKHHLYCENPPTFRYADIKRIVSLIKIVGTRITGKPVIVGETFDPGPEFAVSTFKYERHREICLSTMADFPFVGCYATLHADIKPYAGFPKGIEEGTPFGTFFGRQSQHFLSDLGFDYIWFSNGFGFGIEPWNASGAVFDGQVFDNTRATEVAHLCLKFWQDFRTECAYPIKTRGTNMTTGIDISTDAVPLRSIYQEVKDIEPPPNSPWVSLDGDFGLELAGWMSHIAQIPGTEYPFRFYTHDPWWDNSPWLDRYERSPHDIYMPMSVARIGKNGQPEHPSILELLTVDNSFGETPDQVPNEVIPHILYAREHLPDAPGPLVWVYPFDMYHDMLELDTVVLPKIFLGDWYIRSAINRGLPLNTVVDANILTQLFDENAVSQFSESTLLIPVLKYEPSFFRQILSYAESGGRVLLYGSVDCCPQFFLDALGLTMTTPITGDCQIATNLPMDFYSNQPIPSLLRHCQNFSDGGIDTIANRPEEVLITANQESEERTYAICTRIGNGTLAWIRASNSFESPIQTQLPIDLDHEKYLRPAVLLRSMLSVFGIDISFEGSNIEDDEPVQVISRNEHAFWFAGHVPDTTVLVKYKMPLGAPLFVSYDTVISNGYGTYRFEHSFMKESRIFIQGQREGSVVRTSELATVNPKFKRRLLVRGLDCERVTFLEEPEFGGSTIFQRDFERTHYRRSYAFDPSTVVDVKRENSALGSVCILENYTGNLLISW